MRSGRREFLAGVGAVASLGSLLPLPNAAAQVRPAPRMRLEEFVTSPGRVEALKRGVAAMKARRPSDPKSWFFQAAVHGVSDLAIVEAERADPAVRAVVSDGRFWNKCPHHGEPSADFLLWHRAYLFYFERILREASGDPSLSVPYWNYNDPAQRAFPGLFADADRADPRDPDSPARNPLFDERREASLVAGVTELSERAVSLTAVMNERDFFGVDEFDQEAVQTTLDEVTRRTGQGGSEFAAEPSTNMRPSQFPQALVGVLFRPFPWQATNVQALVAATESVFLMGLFLANRRGMLGALRSAIRVPYVVLCCTYTVLFVYGFSSFSNAGILVRQRVQVLPFVLVLVCLPVAAVGARPQARQRDDEVPSMPAVRQPEPIL